MFARPGLFGGDGALRRMAELVDAGRAAGEIATQADNQHVLSQDKHPAALTHLGISRQRPTGARYLALLGSQERA